YNLGWQWHGEKRQGTIESIALAKSRGLKVFLKPHIWLHDGWVGDLEFTSEADWLNFEKTYSKYILDFANIADSMNVEAYAVGVELKKSVVQRASYWNKLIDSVKTVYSGKLTYAANWDNYEFVTFWNKLDYIGIDAYFPVSVEQTPSFESCYSGWEADFQKIKARSITENRKVVFTEFGYRNLDLTGKEPWDDNGNATNNTEAQDNAYKALFCRFWSEPWFEGGFIWKWYPNHTGAGGSNRFTPQNKPVEEIIRNTFAQTND
ncbi:glycoside hydrolase, partial [bacterium]|nr:glycoside hydrolase [bacterium]